MKTLNKLLGALIFTIISAMISYLLGFRHYYYLIVEPLLIGVAIFFTAEKGAKGFMRCLSILVIASVLIGIILISLAKSLGEWFGLVAILLLLIRLVEAAAVTFIFNPLIRKFYLKEN